MASGDTAEARRIDELEQCGGGLFSHGRSTPISIPAIEGSMK